MTYQEKLIEASEFQDFVSDMLYDTGIPINLYTSKKYQYNKGESRAGFEIKHDRQFESTGNLFIEVKERHDPEGQYVPSGILRKDNTLFYVIGDYKRTFLFGKKQLIKLIKTQKFRLVENGDKTGIGYLIPVVRKRPEQEWVLDEHKDWLLAEWKDGKLYEKEKQQTSEIRKEPIFSI
jgi:hypothetical protein